jgi:hypothetical protein
MAHRETFYNLYGIQVVSMIYRRGHIYRLLVVAVTAMVVLGSVPIVVLADSEPNDSQGQAESLSVGVQETGSLDQGDEDWFEFTAQRGQSLELTASRSTAASGNYFIRIATSSGSTLASAFVSPGETETFGDVIESTGTYYVEVDGDSDGYTFTLNSVSNDAFEPNEGVADAVPYTVGQSQSGSLTAADQDWFEFTAQRGQSLELAASRSTAASGNYFIRIATSSGSTLASAFVSPGETETIGDVLQVNGTYYVQVDGDSGDYTFTLNTVPNDAFEPNEGIADAVPYTVGQSQSGTLVVADQDWFSFDAQRGQSLELTASRSGGATGNYFIRIATPAGSTLASAFVSPGETETIGDVIEVNGTYYVQVDGDSDDYTFTLNTVSNDAFEPNEGIADAVPYTVGQSQSGTLVAADNDWFSFDAQRGQSLELSASRSTAAMGNYFVRIATPAGSTLDSAFIDPGETETIGDVIEANGTYYVQVDGDSGDYTFTLNTVPNDAFEPNEAISDSFRLVDNPRGPIEGQLTTADNDWFTVTAAAGESINVTASRPTAETGNYFIRIATPAGSTLDSVFVDPGDTDDIGTVVQSSGTYYVQVDGDSGTYTADVSVAGEAFGLPNDRFELNENFSDPAPIVPGIVGDLAMVDDDLDYFAIEADQGDRIDAAILFDNADNNLTLQLFDPGQSLVAESATAANRENVSFTATQSGTHYVRVSGDQGAVGLYVLQASVISSIDVTLGPGADSLGPGNSVTYDLTLTNAETDVGSFNVTLTSGNVSVVELTGATAVNGTADVTVAQDGSSLTITVTNASIAGGEAVVIAQITAQGGIEGSTTVEVGATPDVQTTTDVAYPINSVQGTTVTVVGGVDLAVGPGTADFQVGDTATYDVTVSRVDPDVASYDLRLTSSDASVLAITDVTSPVGTADVSVAQDGASATINVTGAGVTSASAVLARVSVAADGVGIASLNVSGAPATAVRTSTGLVYPLGVVQGTDATVSTTVGLVVGPGTDRLQPTNVTAYNVSVSNAVGGVDSVSFTVETSNLSVLSITGVTGVSGTPTVTVAPDGSSATVSATGAALPAGSSVVVATVAVLAELEGEATVNVTGTPAPTVATAGGVAYTVSGSQATTVTVSTSSLPAEFQNGIPGSTSGLPPTNVDDDPAYEDLNGDGVFNFVDVIEFVFALGPIGSSNLSADAIAILDHNGDGRVNFVDVIDLVFQL